MSEQNLKDTLAYRPPKPSQREILSDVEKMVVPEAVNIGESLKQLEENLPSKVLGKADVATLKVKTAMSEIEGRLKRTKSNGVSFADFQAALEGDDFDVIEQFESGHRDSIAGNPAGELYGSLHYVSKDLAASIDMMKSNNYDSDVNPDSYAGQDKKMMNQMVDIEQGLGKGKTGVNYDAVYLDTVINNSMGEYFDNTGGFADGVLSIVDREPGSDEKVVEDKEVFKSITEDTFRSENNMNLKDVHKIRQLDRSSLRLQAQSTMYDKRNTTVSGAIPKTSVANIKSASLRQTLNTQLKSKKDEANNSILDLKKINKLESMYRRDLLSSVGRKQELRAFHGIL